MFSVKWDGKVHFMFCYPGHRPHSGRVPVTVLYLNWQEAHTKPVFLCNGMCFSPDPSWVCPDNTDLLFALLWIIQLHILLANGKEFFLSTIKLDWSEKEK